MSNGSQFYVDRALELIVDPLGPPVVQNQLLDELKKCDHLVQLDWRYAQMVAGASKMPMNMIWVARNQDEPVSDTDLAALKDLAWSEIVKKRYLTSVPGTSTVSETATSMLEIVREMNLQRRRFQIMGLHEQVEASEIHLVLHLCQAGLIRTDKYRITANRFRRHDKLFEAFGLAVGAFVCASAPFTLGAATTRYERDLQYEYKKNATALFVYCLQQNMGGMNAVELEEDYVARIARLIVVWPDEDGSGKRRIGFRRPGGKKGGGGDDDDDDDKGGDLKSMVLNSVVEAQDCAEKAQKEVGKLRGEIGTQIAVWNERHETERIQLNGVISEAEQKIRTDLMNEHRQFERTQELKHATQAAGLMGQVADVKTDIRVLWGRFENHPVHGGGGSDTVMGVDAGMIDGMEKKIDAFGRRLDGFSGHVLDTLRPEIMGALRPEIKAGAESVVGEATKRIKEDLDRLAQKVDDEQGKLTQRIKDHYDQYDTALNTRFKAIEDVLHTKANQADLDDGIRNLQDTGAKTKAEVDTEIAKIRSDTDRCEQRFHVMEGLVDKQERQMALLAQQFEAMSHTTDTPAPDAAAPSPAGGQPKAELGVLFKTALDGALDEMTRKLAAQTARQIRESMKGLEEKFDQFKEEVEETQSDLMANISTISEDLPGRLTNDIIIVDDDDARSSSQKRPRSASTARPVDAAVTRGVSVPQKLTDVIKAAADLYIRQSDWDGKIARAVQRCVAEQSLLVKPEDMAVDHQPPAAAPPPMDIARMERRLQALELLFLNTTSAATDSPFSAPPPPPDRGDFASAPPPGR